MRPSASGHAGGCPPAAVARAASASNSVTPRIGFVKNEPALTESGSSGSTTMPLARRRPSTASRCSPSGARLPRSTSSARASSA